MSCKFCDERHPVPLIAPDHDHHLTVSLEFPDEGIPGLFVSCEGGGRVGEWTDIVIEHCPACGRRLREVD